MPYINKVNRGALQSTLDLENFVEKLGTAEISVGDLNYIVTRIINRYFEIHTNYQGINDVIGVMESAKLEFYRRKAADYEDQKIRDNGDV